ncbi:MAG: hypothetical protein Q7T46_11670 [Polaromonas sp.]|nr:hypothetical protein [Polaromonas sp.]
MTTQAHTYKNDDVLQTPTQPSQAVELTEREKFETWATNLGFSIARGSMGLYTSLGTNQLFTGWLGCTEFAASQRVPVALPAEPVAWMKTTNIPGDDWDAYDFSANQYGDFQIPLFRQITPANTPAGAGGEVGADVIQLVRWAYEDAASMVEQEDPRTSDWMWDDRDDLANAIHKRCEETIQGLATPAPPKQQFPQRILELIKEVARREDSGIYGAWQDENGEPMQDDADAALAWITKQQPALGRGEGGGVPLSEATLGELYRAALDHWDDDLINVTFYFARAIEAAHGIGVAPAGQINPDSAGQGVEGGG